MAQASSAQREPSMEEILASIRRIIEDGDAGRQAANDTAAASVQPEPAAVRAEPTIVDVDAFRAELGREVQPAAASVAPEPTPTVTRPLSLADIQAEVRRSTPPADEHDFASRFASLAKSAPAAEASALSPEPATAPAEDVAIMTGNPPAAPQKSEPAWEPAAFAPVEPPEPVAGPVPSQPAKASPPARTSILSEHAQRQVAASFGELWEAFSASRQRSFDEMAEEMMRPMLQEWLDNNLPTLVERLVREEIERVARGG